MRERETYPECPADVESDDEHPEEGGHEEEVHDDGQREAAGILDREIVIPTPEHGGHEADVAAEQRHREREQIFAAQILKVRRQEGGHLVEQQTDDGHAEADDRHEGHGAAELGDFVGGVGERCADDQDVVVDFEVVALQHLVVLLDVDDARVHHFELAHLELELWTVDKSLAVMMASMSSCCCRGAGCSCCCRGDSCCFRNWLSGCFRDCLWTTWQGGHN